MSSNRDIDQMPIRCQHLLLRLMRYNAVANHLPGKDQLVADTLPRQPLISKETPEMAELVQAYVDGMMATILIMVLMLEQIKEATKSDETLIKAIDFTQSGWPRLGQNVDEGIAELFHVRDELTVIDEMLVHGQWIVISMSMRGEIITKLHEGHQGVTKCRERANQTVWWPRLSLDIDDYVKHCQHCQE